jgi:hypothetical protein
MTFLRIARLTASLIGSLGFVVAAESQGRPPAAPQGDVFSSSNSCQAQYQTTVTQINKQWRERLAKNPSAAEITAANRDKSAADDKASKEKAACDNQQSSGPGQQTPNTPYTGPSPVPPRTRTSNVQEPKPAPVSPAYPLEDKTFVVTPNMTPPQKPSSPPIQPPKPIGATPTFDPIPVEPNVPAPVPSATPTPPTSYPPTVKNAPTPPPTKKITPKAPPKLTWKNPEDGLVYPAMILTKDKYQFLFPEYVNTRGGRKFSLVPGTFALVKVPGMVRGSATYFSPENPITKESEAWFTLGGTLLSQP